MIEATHERITIETIRRAAALFDETCHAMNEVEQTDPQHAKLAALHQEALAAFSDLIDEVYLQPVQTWADVLIRAEIMTHHVIDLPDGSSSWAKSDYLEERSSWELLSAVLEIDRRGRHWEGLRHG